MKLFSHTERRGLIFLAPLLVVVILLVAVYEMRDVELLSDGQEQASGDVGAEREQIKPFNPNVDSFEQLREAGVPTEVAVGIVRWRRYGKVYRMAEDLALVSGVNDSIYAVLKPYVVIADSVAVERRAEARGRVEPSGAGVQKDAGVSRGVSVQKGAGVSKAAAVEKRKARITPQPFAIDTASAEYLSLWGLTIRQAEVLVKYRDASGGIFSQEHLRRCYVVDGSVADSLAKYIIYSEESEVQQPERESNYKQSLSRVKSGDVERAVEVNSADSATLVAINGIGPKSASEIIKYRDLLGGYHSAEQIKELKCVTNDNFVKFLPKISCDSCKISKIDINFATPKELERHPYISAQALRRIIKQRQLKGGWSRIEEMTEQNILSKEEAKRLAPYLRFGPSATE